MRSSLWTIAVVLVAFTACSSDDGTKLNGDIAQGDANDVFFPETDATVQETTAQDGTNGTETSEPGDTSGDTETSGPCNTFGCACSSNADCLDELCVEGPEGRICTQPCVTECPSADFACVPIVLGGADPFNACVPQHPNLCKPCRDDSECKNELQPSATTLCLPAPDPKDGSFCASSCAQTPCPDGYTCSEVALDGGGTAKQCIPTDGTCECLPAWASMSLVTDCQRDNAIGTCSGERTCGLSGLTACDAAPAADESCNNQDDDCDGVTDNIVAATCTMENNGIGACEGTTACEGGEQVCSGTAAVAEACNLNDDDCDGTADDGTCSDGLACTDDLCAGANDCQNPIKTGQCVIDGKCYAENEANPTFPCQRCVPAVSQTAWTGSSDGPSCFIDGQCYPGGAGKDGEPCLRCRPDVSTTTWSPAAAADAIACDDGVACTSNDTCNGGACLGTAYTCDDGKQCTDNVCDGAGDCNYPVIVGSCLIDGECYSEGSRADATTCRVCSADNREGWSAPTTALSCDDGNTCTSNDVCAGATCAGAAYECDDETACTVDTCDGAGGCVYTAAANFCVIDDACFADGAKDPTNACLACKVAVSDDDWTAFTAGEHVACDDGRPCTQGDECTAGLCLGNQYSCGDDKSCTDDVCDGAGGCTNPVKVGNCLIAESCYAEGARENDTSCNVCDDATPTAWSPATTALSCNDSNGCTKDDVCAGATCGGTAYSCDDGAACTADACDGTGGCTNDLMAGFCRINGACYATGAVNPSNTCLVCDPSHDRFGWKSKANGESCSDGNACSYGDTCSFGSCLAIPYDCIGAGCCVGDGTCTSTPPVGVVEQCNNSIDDDCDGVTDEGEPEVCADNADNDCDGNTDEAGNTWGEVFFARSWRVTNPPTVAIYTSENDGTFESPKVITFPSQLPLGIVGVGDFDADRFNDLVVAGAVYGNDFLACGAGCPVNQVCVGGGCVPRGCTVGAGDTCAATRAGTQCMDTNEYSEVDDKVCSPPTRVHLARETCPSGTIGLNELFTLPPGDYVAAIIDVNNDGHLDFVIRKNWQARRGYVMLNGGDSGNFQFTRVEFRADGTTPALMMPGNAPGTPYAPPCSWVYNVSKTSKDLNGDGIVDLLGTCVDTGGASSLPKLWWWRGRGDGTFDAYQQFHDLAGSGVTQFGLLTMNDFNRDGTQDIVGGVDDDGDSGTIWPIIHRSAQSQNHWLAGSLAYDVMPTLWTADGPGVGGGTSADFNADGYADLLVGWVPDRSECFPINQGGQGPNCAFSELAVLTNTSADPCGAGSRCNGTSCVMCTRGEQLCDVAWECGTNACGDACGPGCAANEICQGHTCVTREACVADCTGRTCGDNGCGGVCGICADGNSCNAAGQCVASSTCGSCNGQTCGTDGCGMPCVFFDDTYTVAEDTNGRGGEAPTNAPPTMPAIRIQPTNPADNQDLICTVSVPSYDIDPVQYQYRWYRKPQGQPEVFAGLVSNRPLVPASMTALNEQWRCEVTATDRLEYSPRAQSATVTIGGLVSAPLDPASPR